MSKYRNFKHIGSTQQTLPYNKKRRFDMEISRSNTPIGFFEVTGKTFPHKDDLRKLGGVWNPNKKMWIFRDNSFSKVDTLLRTKNPPKVKSLTIVLENSPPGYFDVIGDTFPHKDKFKILGGAWITKYKSWRFKNSKIFDVEDFLASTREKKVILPIETPKPQIIKFKSDFLFELFNTGGKTLKYPKIRLVYKGKELLLKEDLLSKRGINIYDLETKKKPIAEIRNDELTDYSGLNLIKILKELSETPLKTLKTYGFLTGRCPFCYKQLCRKESIRYGYGPVCARTYGLEAPY